MNIDRAKNIVAYKGCQPQGVNTQRWQAMVTHIKLKESLVPGKKLTEKEELDNYLAFLKKRLASDNYKANVSKEEYDKTKAQYDKAKFRYRLMK